MKIGIFDPYLDSLSGGEKYMLTAALSLVDKHEVFVLWDLKFESEIREKAQTKLGLDLSKIKFADNIFSKKFSFLSRFQLSRKYDTVLFLSDGSIPLIWSKLYVHFQFPVEHVEDANSLKTKLKISRIKQFICNSNFTKFYVDKKFGRKSIVIYPPVEIKIDKPLKKENIILHVGRFGLNVEGLNFKKQDIMIEAFKNHVKKFNGWRFILVISFRKEDKEKLNELKIKARGCPIEIIENSNDSLLWEMYAKAKIYWHASGFGENLKLHPEKAEHFGISTVEAMGAGAVPIVINAGGQTEIVDDGKNGFLWNKIEELVEKTNLLINKPELMGRMSKEAVKKSTNFSKDHFYKRINKVIEE